jgi:hypothetical protein
MKTFLSRNNNPLTFTASTIAWTAAGAAVVAPVGALLGACVGAVQAVLYGSPAAFLPSFTHLTLCGAATGAILGAFIKLTDGHNPLASGDGFAGPARRPRAVWWRRHDLIPTSLLDRIQGRHSTNSRQDGPHDPSRN